MKYILSIVILFTVLIFSCKKSDSTTSTQTKTQLISSAAWKYDTATVKIFGVITPIPAGYIPDCSRDNLYTFNSNNTGVASEGTNQCSGSPASSPFTWAFANNETQLTISGASIGPATGTFNIVALNETKLSLSKDTVVSGVNSTVIVDFKH